MNACSDMVFFPFKHAPSNVTFDALMLYTRLFHFFSSCARHFSFLDGIYENVKISKDESSKCVQNTKPQYSYFFFASVV